MVLTRELPTESTRKLSKCSQVKGVPFSALRALLLTGRYEGVDTKYGTGDM